jgi:antitoxin MazE
MHAAKLHPDQQVDIRESEGSVVITPVWPVTYELAALLEGITDDNLHGEISTGDAVGRENRQ